jgi:hypothetical protein
MQLMGNVDNYTFLKEVSSTDLTKGQYVRGIKKIDITEGSMLG